MPQTGRRMEKVKISTEEVEIHWTVAKKGKLRDLETLVSEDRPIPQFRMALQAFDKFVHKLCEWPDPDKEGEYGIQIGIVHISYNEKGVRGIVITGKRELEGANGPFCFNTPFVAESVEVGTVKFDEATSKALDNLIKQANAYLDGERLQGELPLETKKKSEKNKETDEQKTGRLLDGTSKN